MSPKKKVREFINVRLTKETHARLEAFSRKGETWDEVVKRLIHDIEQVYFEIISVDSKPPQGYSVVYQIGHVKYLYNNGNHTLLSRL